MDPTDARRVVRRFAALEEVELGEVLGRSRATAVARARRESIRSLIAAGVPHREIAALFGRSRGTIAEIAKPWRSWRRVVTRADRASP